MSIKKATPRDLLSKYRYDDEGNELFKPCRTEAKMKFYLKAIGICQECDHREEVLLGHDENVYHECNQGNRVSYVPRSLK